MAPAQILDLPQTQTNYTHKKFQGNRYAHKKFGTRTPPPVHHHQVSNEHGVIVTHIGTTIIEDFIQPPNNKRSSGDIFRPYALGEDTPRKRKHHEIHEGDQHQARMDSKRFAPSPIYQGTPSPHYYAPAFTPTPQHYRLQHFQFNPQVFALILQKQQAALCMGAILKRQTNFNLRNIMGQ